MPINFPNSPQENDETLASNGIRYRYQGGAWRAIVTDGRHTIWIPKAAMKPLLTNGAGAETVETATNKNVIDKLNFDPAAIEYAQFGIRMPRSWDEGTVSASFVWTHGATATDFKVSWGLSGVALSDGDALDVAQGTPQYANDEGGTTDVVYTSPETAAITIAGSPAAEDFVLFQVSRKADDATNDTLAIDSGLLGVTLYYNTDTYTDAA